MVVIIPQQIQSALFAMVVVGAAAYSLHLWNNNTWRNDWKGNNTSQALQSAARAPSVEYGDPANPSPGGGSKVAFPVDGYVGLR